MDLFLSAGVAIFVGGIIALFTGKWQFQTFSALFRVFWAQFSLLNLFTMY